MRVVITNTVVLNGGDAAILYAIIELLRGLDPKVEITVFDSQPEVARKYHPGIDFRPLSWQRAKQSALPRVARARLLAAASALTAGRRELAATLAGAQTEDLLCYAAADVVISTGGTYLVESYGLDPRFLEFELVRRLARPLVLFTQSLGPFRERKNRRQIARLLGGARLILLRDERSDQNLRELGLSEHLHVCADVVFAGAPDDLRARAAARSLPSDRPLRVGVSVRSWSHFEDLSPAAGMARYREAVASAVTRLVEAHDAELTFVSTCQGIEEYWTNDAQVAQEIVASLPAAVRERVRVDDGFHSPTQLRELLGELDFVIATRMHVAILSLIAGTPVVPIAYEFKTTELFRRLGAADWVTDINNIDPEGFGAVLAGFLDSIDGRRASLFEAVLAERARASEAAHHLMKVLEHGDDARAVP